VVKKKLGHCRQISIFAITKKRRKTMILFALLIASILTQFACSQTKPLWTEEIRRNASHPASEWYTGFSQDILEPKTKAAEALERLERDAQKRMIEGINVRISSKSTTETESNTKQLGKNTAETFEQRHKQAIQASANIEIANAEISSYHDKKTNHIYAFAAVKKKDLANFYRSKINSLFSLINREFTLADQLTEHGKKNVALAKIYAIEDSLKNISYWNSYLQAVESDNSHIAKETVLWQKANEAKIQLQNGTAIYLDISGNEENYSNLDEQLGAQMQEKGCNCTIAEEKEAADYTVTIKAKLSRCNENPYGEVYCYANADAIVNNPKFKKPVNIKIPEAKGGWANGNKDKATEEAYKELTNFLAEKIIQTITQ
jgi:hypothetical protein